MNVRLMTVVLAALALFPAAAFAQAETPADGKAAAPALSPEAQVIANVKALYAAAKFEECRAAVEKAIALQESGELRLLYYQEAELYVYKALVVYAFRESGTVTEAERKEIERWLGKAVELDINYNFADYTSFPAYILDKYRVIKEAYLARFAKSSRRHNLGVHVMMSYLSASLSSSQNFILGIHYGFNLNDALALVCDVEVPFTDQFYNMMKFRVGAVWFTSFRVETFSLGLGLFNSLNPEANWTAFVDSVSFEGYGEIIFRSGLGMGASIEVVRGDFLFFGAESFPAIENVSFFSSEKVRLGFANVRLYLFWTF